MDDILSMNTVAGAEADALENTASEKWSSVETKQQQKATSQNTIILISEYLAARERQKGRSITEYHADDPRRWNLVVRSFPNYDAFYLAEYALAFMQENPKNGEPVLLLYEDGCDRAINVVLRRDIALDDKLKGKLGRGKYYDLISPYGYGGFWGQVTDWDRLNRAYNDYCHANHYVCEFVRFHLFSDYAEHYDGEVESRTRNVVRSLDMPLDDMWMDFKHKVRKNVKRACSSNLEILIEPDDAHLDDFLRIYYETMERTNARRDFFFSRNFYESMCKMRDNVMFFHVLFEGKVISTELVLYGPEICYSYLGGTDANYMHLRPNDFLKYEVIKWAKSKGLKNYVLGGGYGADDGIFQYKYALAPHGVVDFHIGRKIFHREDYDMLVGLRNDEMNGSFFPLYRS